MFSLYFYFSFSHFIFVFFWGGEKEWLRELLSKFSLIMETKIRERGKVREREEEVGREGGRIQYFQRYIYKYRGIFDKKKGNLSQSANGGGWVRKG